MNNKIIERVTIFILAVASISAVIISSLYFVKIAQAINKEQSAKNSLNNLSTTFDPKELVSASKNFSVAATVLPNLSLSIDNNKPGYATNSPNGVTFSVDSLRAPITYWTVSANY